MAAALAASSLGALAAQAASVTYRVGPIRDVSAALRGQNAEVEEAADPSGSYVYVEWIGANGIGFARSTDRGAHFRRAFMLPGSGGGWDPAVAVSSTGTVYAAFMVTRAAKTFPVVASSFDHGRSFSRLTRLFPARAGNWGDRVFIAAGPGNAVYVTWDYGPSGSRVGLNCPANGSCALTSGQLNIVMQVSTDGGKSFGPMSAISPGFPASGADSAPVVVDPSGRVDVLYTRFAVYPHRHYAFGPGHVYFTSSGDRGHTWTSPVLVGGSVGSISQYEWWIDGALASDAGGDLYATWDTQGAGGDRGWLAYSADHGLSWSAPVRVTAERYRLAQIVQAAGGPPGIAYVGWLSNRHRVGYGEHLRTFSIARGWLSAPERISRRFGTPNVWPGDTFGIATVSPRTMVLSWGSAVPGTRGRSEIYAARAGVGLP